jgi:Spy/CpxP family protein refolding chaperone
MKTRTFLTHLVAVAGLVGLAAFSAQAQAPGGGGPRGILTQEQRTKMRDAMQGSQTDLTQLNEKLAAAQKDALKAILAKNPDEKTVRAKIEAVTKVQVEMAMLRFKALKEIAPTLTEEQKTQMEERPALGYNALLGGFGGMGPGGRRGGGAGGGPANQ